MADPDELISRLASSTASVRRIAIFDLIRLRPRDPRATEALLDHLPREADQRAALAIIRHLAAAGIREASPALWRLHEDPATPAPVAHAAVIAHDQLAAPAAPAVPLECANGEHSGEHHDQAGGAA